MIPRDFDPVAFKGSYYIAQNGLITLDYSDQELQSMFNYSCSNLGQTLLDITATNALQNGLDVNQMAMWTGWNILAQYLYCIQYRLMSQVIDGHKGQEGATFSQTASWRNSWDKTPYGTVLGDILENNTTIQGHNGLYIWDQVTG